MPLVIFAVLLIAGLAMQYTLGIKSKQGRQTNRVGQFDPTTGRLNRYDTYTKHDYGDDGLASAESAQKLSIEDVETILIRTCRTLHTNALYKSCPNAYRENYIWSFVGLVGGTGTIDPIWAGSTVATFSACVDAAPYARGLIQKAIPQSSVIGTGLKYDFSVMLDEDQSDPCGYTEIVKK